MVQTVLGPIDPGELGITSMHEHVLIDLRCYFRAPGEASERGHVDAPVSLERLGSLGRRWWYNSENCTMLDERVGAEELGRWRTAGGASVVDVTSIGIARDPLALARVSRASGVAIVMGASHYVPVTYTDDLHAVAEDELAESIARDVEVGVGDTGVRAGVIGEVGNFWPTNDTSRKVLRASGAASARTGAAVTVHPGFVDEAMMHHVADLAAGGADPSRMIMGHVDTMSVEAIGEVADAGAYVQFDTFGLEDTLWGEVHDQDTAIPTDEQRLDRIERLVEWGHEDRVLVAHDVCFRSMLAGGGGKGFAHLLENIVPRMRRRGMGGRLVQKLLVDNPARALAFPQRAARI